MLQELREIQVRTVLQGSQVQLVLLVKQEQQVLSDQQGLKVQQVLRVRQDLPVRPVLLDLRGLTVPPVLLVLSVLQESVLQEPQDLPELRVQLVHRV